MIADDTRAGRGSSIGVVQLTGLEGGNPLSFLAALGVLDVCTRAGLAVGLRWTDDLVPTAVLQGSVSMDDLLDCVAVDQAAFADAAVLRGPPDHRLTDAKPPKDVLRTWAHLVGATPGHPVTQGAADQDLFVSLVAEGAADRTARGGAKPTHLHFSAGQQQFLQLAQGLAVTVSRAQVEQALVGPWVPDPAAKTFGWNAGGERVFAFRATDPSGERRPGYPGPDWLAFRGLSFLPVVTARGRDALVLLTTACESGWKTSSFRWPLWGMPLGGEEVRSLIGSLVPQPARRDSRPVALSATDIADLRARGVLRVLRAPITRSDQGGYGSFGGADIEFEAVPGS